MSDIKNEIKEELTTDHDIYISIGLKHPMKPTDCRDLIDSLIVDNFTLSSWGTHTKEEWLDVVKVQQEKITTLITTIESQQQELDKAEKHNKGAWDIADDLSGKIDLAVAEIAEKDAFIESQKEEIEKLNGNIEGLNQRLEDKSPYAAQQYWGWLLGNGKKEMQAEIESLKAITELAVKGLKKVVNENTGFPRMVARETISEIERLKNG